MTAFYPAPRQKREPVACLTGEVEPDCRSACWLFIEETAMKNRSDVRTVFPASTAERASIRALKHWLLAMPGESLLQDQIVRLRIADAIARLAPGKLARKVPKPKRRMQGAAKA
jgi:hypothetical protein